MDRLLELAILAVLPCLDLNDVGFHIHAKIEGVEIPKNIGISPGCFREIHTHDTSGWLHLESSEPKDFTLRQFFELWGKPTDGIQPLINGKWETMDTPLQDMDIIKFLR